ncbi:hypothetical protein HYH03_014190 [Edaphochlamys debaryana]|uniref:Uncharacterized protein n=1 Tax=Edaphochlamys debaryana TaxID=47281 RepID=A0A835XNM9_9CHLO|nr:hypothetical protein HYH03_014190 [Edaphochlamys debaryana]|eukprot:KAG2487216.1 hypothetical protein HYH03_014190 [Edaphochlamys debaryana]
MATPPCAPAGAFLLLALGLFASLASASHFRAGMTAWRIDENDQLEITLTSSWQDGSGGIGFINSDCGISFSQSLADGGSIKFKDAAGIPYYTLT